MKGEHRISNIFCPTLARLLSEVTLQANLNVFGPAESRPAGLTGAAAAVPSLSPAFAADLILRLLGLSLQLQPVLQQREVGDLCHNLRRVKLSDLPEAHVLIQPLSVGLHHRGV